MRRLGVFALLVLICGQETVAQDPRLSSLLSPAEIAVLRAKVRDWFALRDALESDPGDRERLQRELGEAKQAFLENWREKDPIAHVGDLLGIFDGVFARADKRGEGRVVEVDSDVGGVGSYGRVVPAGYDAAREHPAVVMIEDGAQRRDFEAEWGGLPFAAKAIFILPPPATAGASDTERMRAMRRVLREVGRDYRLDRDRLILDCGRGATTLGLRMASGFPGLFAGIVLRDPEEVDGLALGPLCGLKILMVHGNEHLETALVQGAGLRLTRLEADPSSSRVVSRGIDQWAASVERPLFPTTVVLEPKRGLGTRAHWAEATDLVGGARQSLVVEADRRRNEIIVTSEGVSKVRVLLNDALLDLDREITLVINGVRHRARAERHLDAMLDRVFRRRDSGCVFPGELSVAVPPVATDDVNARVADRLRGLIAAADAEAALRSGRILYSGFAKGVEEGFGDARAAYGLLLPAADQVMRGGEIGLGLWGFGVICAAQDRHPVALANLALAMRHAGMEARAEELYREALRASPRDHTTWNDYGLLFKGIGQADRAREALAQSMDLQGDPPTGSAVTNLAVLEVMTGQKSFPDACVSLSLLLAQRPTAALARRTLLDLLTSSPDRMR